MTKEVDWFSFLSPTGRSELHLFLWVTQSGSCFITSCTVITSMGFWKPQALMSAISTNSPPFQGIVLLHYRCCSTPSKQDQLCIKWGSHWLLALFLVIVLIRGGVDVCAQFPPSGESNAFHMLLVIFERPHMHLITVDQKQLGWCQPCCFLTLWAPA